MKRTTVHGYRAASSLVLLVGDGALGLAILSTIAINAACSKAVHLASLSGGYLPKTASNISMTHGYTKAFQVGAGIALLALVISAVVIRAPKDLAAPHNLHEVGAPV